MTDEILVTGAAGFLGTHLVSELASRGHDVTATDLLSEPPDAYSQHVGKNIRYIEGDVTDPDFRTELTADTYDRVFHLAAIVGVDSYIDDPLELLEVNVVATKRLIEAFRDTATRFIFTSTSEIYGKNPEVPWQETADRVLGPPIINRWSYSISKSACEHMLHALDENGEMDATVVRPFNLYGPRQRPKFVIPAFVKAVVNGDVPQVYGDGSQTRCFTYIDDFVDGLCRASTAPSGANAVFNIGSTTETSILELAETVLSVAGRGDERPEFVDPEAMYGDEYEDLDRRVPDTSRASTELDWEATTSLADGLEATLSWAEDAYP